MTELSGRHAFSGCHAVVTCENRHIPVGLRASKIDQPTNMISIGSPGDWYEFACEHKRVLRLVFDDVDGFVGSDGLKPFTLDQARELIDFVETCGDEPVTVHCMAGMSRSAAVARFMMTNFGHKLLLDPPCIGHTTYLNRHVYSTLEGADGGSLVAYYAELELADRMRADA